jgi:hypothetical protein
MSPVNFDESVPPKVSSPSAALVAEVLGMYDMPIDSRGIVPCLNKLSVTVGTDVVDPTVPRVRSTGPMLSTTKRMSGQVRGRLC